MGSQGMPTTVGNWDNGMSFGEGSLEGKIRDGGGRRVL